ncbi:hypothetical protein J3R30DRAFT_3403840 [Lentinula aciculospora]|uniref:Uncharacterized protein n=1 Tax=Lentinula aciculospora TaxID=153920 RepID=A0A9W9ABP3_9AGAR|nr:hypothetical protein J3R30DRAFT_3403840 [Lentinula aciculospora]
MILPQHALKGRSRRGTELLQTFNSRVDPDFLDCECDPASTNVIETNMDETIIIQSTSIAWSGEGLASTTIRPSRSQISVKKASQLSYPVPFLQHPRNFEYGLIDIEPMYIYDRSTPFSLQRSVEVTAVSSSTDRTGTIVESIIGALVFVIIAVLCIFCIRRWSRRRGGISESLLESRPQPLSPKSRGFDASVSEQQIPVQSMKLDLREYDGSSLLNLQLKHWIIDELIQASPDRFSRLNLPAVVKILRIAMNVKIVPNDDIQKATSNNTTCYGASRWRMIKSRNKWPFGKSRVNVWIPNSNKGDLYRMVPDNGFD